MSSLIGPRLPGGSFRGQAGRAKLKPLTKAQQAASDTRQEEFANQDWDDIEFTGPSAGTFKGKFNNKRKRWPKAVPYDTDSDVDSDEDSDEDSDKKKKSKKRKASTQKGGVKKQKTESGAKQISLREQFGYHDNTTPLKDWIAKTGRHQKNVEAVEREWKALGGSPGLKSIYRNGKVIYKIAVWAKVNAQTRKDFIASVGKTPGKNGKLQVNVSLRKAMSTSKAIRDWFHQKGIQKISKYAIDQLKSYDGNSHQQFLSWHKRNHGADTNISKSEFLEWVADEISPHLEDALARQRKKKRTVKADVKDMSSSNGGNNGPYVNAGRRVANGVFSSFLKPNYDAYNARETFKGLSVPELPPRPRQVDYFRPRMDFDYFKTYADGTPESQIQEDYMHYLEEFDPERARDLGEIIGWRA